MEKNSMRDPTTASSRIYVGNINDATTSADLQTHFSSYGTVRGVLLNRGFGFIQFENEASALQAIKMENNTAFQGRKLIVRNAVKNAAATTGTTAGSSTKVELNADGSVIGQDLNRTARRPMQHKKGGGHNGMERDRSPLDDNDRWGGNGNFYGAQFQQQQRQRIRPDQNDCEIIVVTKALTQYAEAIEARLKRMGLFVDLLFPNADVPIGKVLANISSRACLYAILVTEQHEEHRSITVNVLYGQPAEHRNMPVDDAIEFICKDFSKRQMQERHMAPMLPTAVQITPTTNYVVPPLSARHPEAIQTLFNLIADNRPITVLQYDRVIKYLQERRELQLKAEIGDAPPNIPIPDPIDPEVELQKKILDILNKPSITTAPNVVKPPQNDLPKTKRQPNAQQSSSTSANQEPQLLNDPKVQKALDSLLSGNMFNF